MDASQLKAAYHIGPSELPSPTGTVAEIVGVDSEYYQGYQDGRPVDKVRHQLWFKGCRIPLRLNNTRVDLLINMLGKETDAWVGRKIGLFVGVGNHYGKTEPCVMIHVQPVDDMPVTEWPEQYRARTAIGSGKPAFRLGTSASSFGGGGFSPKPALGTGTATPPAEPTTLGKDRAAHVLALLKQRGKTWDDLVSHLKRGGFDISGTHPSELSGACENSVREYLRGFPVTVDVDVHAEISRLLASWEPPAPPPSEPIVIDRRTGEVIGRPPDDDIPF